MVTRVCEVKIVARQGDASGTEKGGSTLLNYTMVSMVF